MSSYFQRSTILLCALAIMPGAAVAEIPRKPTLTRYSELWTNSPFTTKPPPEAPKQGPNPLEDWSLGGISKLGEGYLVLLFNTKDPSETRLIEPGETSEFEVLEIRQDPRDYLQTQVQLRHKGQTGWVLYNREHLELQPPPQQAPQPPQPGEENATPAQAENPPQNQNNNRRRPRQRIVVPQQQ